MKEKLVIVGSGPMAAEVVDFVERYNLFDIIAFSVNKNYLTDNYMDRPVYPLEELEDYIDKNSVKTFIGLGWYNQNKYKRQKYEELKNRGFHFANLISPLSSISYSQIGEGNWIDDFVKVGFGSKIGNNNTFRVASIIGHHTIVGDHNVLSGRSLVSGKDIIGDQNYFGVSSTVFNRLKIGNKNIIGGATIVKEDISDLTIVWTDKSPQRVVKEKIIESFMSPKSSELIKQAL
jgi:carbonic anhydrase/acetyltransferase-like protein (isoleucine patch superfamily)